MAITKLKRVPIKMYSASSLFWGSLISPNRNTDFAATKKPIASRCPPNINEYARKFGVRFCFLNLLIVNDEEMYALNKKFRGDNSVTDVLSFNSSQKIVPILGDIVINIEAANRVNSEMETELKNLFLHGLLHLLGYDHITEKQKNAMMEKEEKYRQMI